MNEIDNVIKACIEERYYLGEIFIRRRMYFGSKIIHKLSIHLVKAQCIEDAKQKYQLFAEDYVNKMGILDKRTTFESFVTPAI